MSVLSFCHAVADHLVDLAAAFRVVGVFQKTVPALSRFLVCIIVPGGVLFLTEDLAEEKIDSVGDEEQNGL